MALLGVSPLDWTNLRPATLSNVPKTAKTKTYSTLARITVSRVSQADAAACIVGLLGDTKIFRRALRISSR